MAARGRILALIVILCAILPLLASAAPPSVDQDFNKLKIRTDGDDSPALLDDDLIRDSKKKRIRVVQRAEKKDNDQNGNKNKKKKGNNAGVNKAVEPAPGGLRVGFYQQTCPQAETIIQETMVKIFERNVKVAPALVRLFFHDCFVTGCDASILLEKTPSGEKTEREAPQNGIFVRGFEEIEEVKAALEAACPGIVSCADTLAYAAREALAENGVQRYPVAAGRRDRPVSLAVNAERDCPLPNSPAQETIKLFERKGLTIDDLVVLIGAHSIGEAHCTVYEGRFQDPEKRKDINPQYLDQLHVQGFCVDQEQTLPFDRMSQNIMDAGFYKQLLAKETLIESDHNLVVEPNTNAIMKKYADDQEGWIARFIQAITKMGEIEVLTGDQGEIRKQCKAFN